MAAVSGESRKREELDAILSSYFQPPADRVLTLMLFVGPRFSVMSSQHLWVMNNKNRANKKRRGTNIYIDILEHLTSARDRQKFATSHDKCPENVFRMNFGFISASFVCVVKFLFSGPMSLLKCRPLCTLVG